MKKRAFIFLLIMMLLVLFQNNIYGVKNNKLTEEQIKENEDKINDYLGELQVEGYDYYPALNKNTVDYFVTIPEDVKKLDIQAKPELDIATLKITGNESLTKTENEISIVVVAKSGRKKKYTIHVTKQKELKNGLKSLNSKIIMEQEFKTNSYSYKGKFEATSKVKLEDLQINAEAIKEGSEIEIIANSELDFGENKITILVKKDSEIVTYQINLEVVEIKNTVQKVESNVKSTFEKISENFKGLFSSKVNVILLIGIIVLIIIIIGMLRKK